MARVSSLDDGYVSGQLSVYPEALDDRDMLYEARNNLEVPLVQTLTYGGKFIVVGDTSQFPASGLLRLSLKNNPDKSPELIYYGSKTNTVFRDLLRGFAGSITNSWPATDTLVSNAVLAEHHNAIKDAVVNIEANLGTEINPETGSLNQLLKDLEKKHLSPTPLFRAYPLYGKPPLTVNFHSFSSGHIIRYYWDFGDGVTSIEKNPYHTYTAEGAYTVKLTVISSLGAQGMIVKNNYITVSYDGTVPFVYVTPTTGTTSTTFEFVDQTDGDVSQRYWVFGDGQIESSIDPDEHATTHQYSETGEYTPTLIVVFSNQRYKRVSLDTITIT